MRCLFVVWLPWPCSCNVSCLQRLSGSVIALLNRSGSVDVIHCKWVSLEGNWLRRNVLEACQFVCRIEWIGWLPGREEPVPAWPRAWNVAISQIELWLIESHVEHSRACSLNVEVAIDEFWSVDFRLRPDS